MRLHSLFISQVLENIKHNSVTEEELKVTPNLTFSLAQTSHPSASFVLARITPLLMTQEGAGGSQIVIVVGFVGGELADVHSSGTWLLNLRIPSIFQDELIKKLQVPLQGESVSLRSLVSILQSIKT